MATESEPLSVFVVTCSHYKVYGAYEDREVAELICSGCCEDAEVVEYVRK